MNFSSLSIKNPIPAVLLFVLLTLAGLIAYKGMGVQDFPDIELPVVTVNASLPGAAPAQLETEVARKIENSIASLSQVKHVFTNVLDGDVNISVEFELEKNVQEAVNDVRDAVSRVRADLPADVRDPVVSKVSTAGKSVVTFAVSSDKLDEQDISWFVDNTIAKRMISEPGVGLVKRMGGLTREIRVELNPNIMASLGVSALEVSQLLRQVQLEAPGGRGDVGGLEQSVRTIATVKSAQELASLQMSLRDGRRVRLDEIATVTDTTAERRSVALLEGKPVVAFEVMRTRGASEMVVRDAVVKAAAQLEAANPNFKITKAIDNAEAVNENFNSSMRLLYEGALLAVLVVWIFLRDWRATLVSASALPLSIIPAFIGMQYFGFTLNTVTLTSMALVVGILVDDAIVEVENIERHLRMGKTPIQAAMEAADEIGLAVIATTFALVAVFLPTAFMAGVPGKFFKQFGWTAVLAILASLVVARLLTPMMSAYLLKPKPEGEKPDSATMRWYMRSVKWCINNRWVTFLLAGLFFAGSAALVPLLPTGFVPPADRGQTMVSVELPPGSTLAQTWKTAEQVRETLVKNEYVKSVFSSVGGGVSGDAFAIGAAAEARKAVMTVTLKHRDDRPVKQQAIEAMIRASLVDQPGVRIAVGPQDTGVKMQVVLRGDDPETLNAVSRDVERDLRTLEGIGNVSSSASLVRPEVIIRPDVAAAADLGVTTQAMAETIRVATAGDYDQSLPKLNLAERQVPIRIKLPTNIRADLEALGRLTVPGKLGPVRLDSVATLKIDSGPAQIDRLDRSRNVTFDVELGSRQLGELYTEALELSSLTALPPGVTIAQLGDAAEMQKLFASFGLAMGIGVLCIYMVLVLLFKDFFQPFTILAALPLAFGGAFVLLLATGNSFSMPSLIGLIMLMGVVTKNSILLVEYAIVARRDTPDGLPGMSRFDALVDACHKRSRPIVMTTIAMVAGMLPVALGYAGDPSFNSPMAVAVIGGLMTSTLLSLLVVPAVYTLVDDIERIVVKLLRRQSHDVPTKPLIEKPNDFL